MSLIRTNFYRIFWQNKTCRNLFLLSKEELLETVTLGEKNNIFSYSVNKIIISNTEENSNEFDAIRHRNENYNNALDISVDDKIEYFRPVLEEFYQKNLQKPIDKLQNDIDKNGLKLMFNVIKIFNNKDTFEEKLLEFLKKYGFVGKHLSSMKEVENYVESKLIPKKGNELINEQTITTFLEGIKFVKELYVSHSYKKLYNTNQILINTLNSEDSFESRIKLFRVLYDAKVILPSKEDSFIECSNCESGTYKGVFQLRLNPNQLRELKCPVCSKELTYFVPYKLDSEIYAILKDKDGLLLNALTNKLLEYDFEYSTNERYLNDIEVDCLVYAQLGELELTYIIETKMFKLNTPKNRLESKIKQHYGKLIKDVKRLQELEQFKNTRIKPLLLVNVTDEELIVKINSELKQNNSDEINQNTDIVNLERVHFRHR